jgi:hypothetical protein
MGVFLLVVRGIRFIKGQKCRLSSGGFFWWLKLRVAYTILRPRLS